MKKIALVFITTILLFGCTPENAVVDDSTSAIGTKDFQGGVLGYVLVQGDPGYDENVQHGLIAAPSDQSGGVQWYNGSFNSTGATAKVLGTGNSNTNSIVSAQGSGSYAARLCSDLVINEYSDWHLPSRDELIKLYRNRIAIGGFSNGIYWSSSEYDSGKAWYLNFLDGHYYVTSKLNPYHIRAVRAF